ncbi:MAG: type II and III secretion system protein family protein [Pseudomonadota bacterium]
MRNSITTTWACALVGLAGLAATALPIGTAHEALATDRHKHKVQPHQAQHRSHLRISHGDPLPQSRKIKLGLNKSMLIELPTALRDVIVSDPKIMDAVVQSSNRVYLIGKKTGQANAFLFDRHGQRLLTLEVSIEQDTGVLEALLRRLIPGSRVKAEMLNNTVILTGSVRNPADSAKASNIAGRFVVPAGGENDSKPENKVVNLIKVEGEEQVMLKVVVAEVQRSLLKQLGINLGAQIQSGNFVTRLLTENALPLTAAAGLGTLPVPGIATAGSAAGQLLTYNNLAGDGANDATAPFGNSGIQGGWAGGNGRSAAYALRALERDGLVKTLAEPNLTAVSGETAKFLAGGEYPVPVVDSQGQLSVTFKEFGVAVSFTPVVMSAGRISLKIETEVSELSNNGAVTLSNISIPALRKRQARSVVELPSGGSIAMAGLISEDTRQNIDGLPGIKNLPVLGTLFRSRDFIKQETELVVIVTPYMVRPTARHKLTRPDQGLAIATDGKANLLGHFNRIYGRGKRKPISGLKGDYGFIVE